ncbi:uncharacterized protein LOC108604629 isoform X2 [Drosophila busckii]|uniref:uncharacterized protein LOC108604629 isoform X2 n=1 Tax=Drosophila busckii TaxID=30019 RepID=UPI00083EA5CE|nr:uncharacterized protein LOC108604629 isoform X2 [Drosophila busckii]
METYGMPAPDDPTIDCYQQYVQQTGYRHEKDLYPSSPVGGANPYDNNENEWNQGACSSYQNSAPAAYSGRGYQQPEQSQMYSRNGLYSPMETRSAGGDYYASLPGLGKYERQPRKRHLWS